MRITDKSSCNAILTVCTNLVLHFFWSVKHTCLINGGWVGVKYASVSIEVKSYALVRRHSIATHLRNLRSAIWRDEIESRDSILRRKAALQQVSKIPPCRERSQPWTENSHFWFLYAVSTICWPVLHTMLTMVHYTHFWHKYVWSSLMTFLNLRFLHVKLLFFFHKHSRWRSKTAIYLIEHSQAILEHYLELLFSSSYVNTMCDEHWKKTLGLTLHSDLAPTQVCIWSKYSVSTSFIESFRAIAACMRTRDRGCT